MAYSFAPRLAEGFDDRAFNLRSPFKRPIAHLQILAERPAERVELLTPCLELRELARQKITNVATARAAGVRLVTHEVADLAQRQAMRLGLFDEPHPIDRRPIVFAKAAGRSTRAWEQALSFVVAQRIARQAACRRQLADAERP